MVVAAGNLFTTALLPYPRPPAEATARLPFAAGLAVIDAARVDGRRYVSTLKLKWPNDVLVRRRQAVGILIETGMLHGKLWMAAGFGVNVEVAPERPTAPHHMPGGLPGGQGLTAQRLLTALDWHSARGFTAF